MARNSLEQMVRALHNEMDIGTRWRDARWQPRADVYQDERALYIQVEAPGLDESTMRVRYESGHLVIEGVRQRPCTNAPCRCLQMEIEYGPFRRVLQLPSEIDAGAIEARLEAGFLLITVPRQQPQNTATKISIE
jgi:HSP20 family protein